MNNKDHLHKKQKLDNNNNSDTVQYCIDHSGQILKLICYQCNVLLCSECKPLHHNHSKIEDIDQIKSFYSKFNQVDNNNNNNGSNNNSCKIQNDITSIWNNIRSSVNKYCQFQQIENDISKEFNRLHEYLVIEEHKLKKPIINDKDTLEHYLNKNIQHLQSLVQIANSIIVQQQQQQEYISFDQSNNETQDTTDKYQINNIIESIEQSRDLNDFIKRNNQTLFNSELLSQDYSILHSIIQYNSQSSNQDVSLHQCSNKQYRFNRNEKIIQSLIKDIQRSFDLTTLETCGEIDTISSFILASDKDDRLSLIDITNEDDCQKFEVVYLDSKIRDSWYVNSTVKVGDYIYSFGGPSMCNLYQRFSIESKRVDLYKEMIGIEPCNYVSVCYDGHAHIYLFDSHQRNDTLVSRYNTMTHQFQTYFTIPNTEHITLSFFYKNKIHSVINSQKRMVIFDPDSKSIEYKDIPNCIDSSESMGQREMIVVYYVVGIYIHDGEVKLFLLLNSYAKETHHKDDVVDKCVTFIQFLVSLHHIRSLRG
ncbi:hypothetical protein PPL_04648 [Heterostelium album PN500]|uniref:B box-type domain-containing protein n=1 Tax=Heterostelium pallidum (strain ATCC 26659 / Pp 5 / PN500) TaxID=670386 RepID=D3B857_HETP5|nr:hypothetical protein PPL_04648 [Heterostelium album PN500]EFA82225.1 hypothetical protein PPL_04648 [Heterostelium album PN500]|eukprot:XP_020434342.1 hypothetical protein PPL_04648 [Heterostelium album PN500]